MASTFTQIHLQFVFVVKNREALILPSWKDELFMYISGLVRNKGHKLIAINGMSDHLHLLIGLRPHQSISDLARDIKANSSRWVNEKKLVRGRFAWQEGYGAFSYAKWDVEKIVNYINNQEEHHRKKAFMQEYLEFLESFGIEYDERYMFRAPQD